MILIILAAVVAALAVATPWRTMSRAASTWAVVASLNAIAALSVPSMPATSPLRPRMAMLSATGYWASIALTVGGIVLWLRADVADRSARRWIPPLVVSALPFLLWSVVGLLFLAGGAAR